MTFVTVTTDTVCLLAHSPLAMVVTTAGVLITSDEATIVYIEWLNDSLVGPAKVILRKLDSRRLFVKADRVRWIQEQLAARLTDTTYDAGDVDDS